MSKSIVMLHGAFCAAWAFDEFRLPFEESGYEVRTPSLRFHECGAEPPFALGTTSLTDYAEDIAKVVDACAEPPILIGHSLGGLLAQMVAAQRTIRGAVLLAPCAPW